MENDPEIQAAGGVLWKPSRKHGFRLALVHRSRYDDWSLPKGKADADETPPQTASREIAEETGFATAIGRRLITVSYSVQAGRKSVQYFSARALGGAFAPNKEVDEIRWMAADAALAVLTYDVDRAVLRAFTGTSPSVRTLILLRHAKAGSREAFAGPDRSRPLDVKGFKQARALARLLAPFSPMKVVSAPILRCEQTVEPLAVVLNLRPEPEPLLDENSYRDKPAAVRRRVTELANSADDRGCVVAASQGGVIPGVVRSLAGQAGIQVSDAATAKAAFWVLSFDNTQLVQADAYCPPRVE